ncbi:DUF6338 family protein [Microbacterium hydrocarbonoxydans]|uniref:DUF6338 family protein n=1 Tax=Microbacterium hydrocarbonoxydans TaxID=273678 RepID=UPI00203ADFA6|nr:DUF6338 family protein [Microbacterium hydrocarbonoxydans]MCM3780657.1 DUF6338 family protein [Microbacterium hydrocarbonoxydans]
MPTDLASVAFYLLLIIPGVVFAFSRERHRPRIKRSAFRETATAIFVSAGIMSLLAFLLSIASLGIPWLQEQIHHFLAHPGAYARARFELFIIIGLLVLVASSALAWILGGERVHDRTLGRSRDPDKESWGYVFTREPSALNFAGVQLKDGTWIQGYVDTYGNVGEEGAPKALTLAGDISIRPPGGTTEPYDGSLIVIKDEEVQYLTVTYVEPDTTLGLTTGGVDPKPSPAHRSKALVAAGVFVAGLAVGLALGRPW